MRILHTADWHFGKTLEGRSRIDEQRAFVDELCDICTRERVDLVLMAGDVYQTVNPSAEAEALFYRALDGLSAGGTRAVVVIAGNHDNAERIAAAGPLAERNGITLMGLPKDILHATSPSTQKVYRVDAGAGYVELAIPGCATHVVVAAVPYPSEARLNEVLADTLDEHALQLNYNARVGAWFAALESRFRLDTVNIAMSHLFVQGGVESESEVQIQIGGAYAVRPEVFPQTAQYVALGHLHRPQGVQWAGAPMRYAGSPLSYSFSEAGQVKSVVIVDAIPGKPVVWHEIPLTSGRRLACWTATGGVAQVLQWVAEERDKDAWIDLEVHVQTGLQLEEIHKLRDVYPGFVHIRPVLATQAVQSISHREGNTVPTIDEHFRKFFQTKLGVDPDVELVQLFMKLVTAVDDSPVSDGDAAELFVLSDGETAI